MKPISQMTYQEVLSEAQKLAASWRENPHKSNETPDGEKLTALSDRAKELGHTLDIRADAHPTDYQVVT